MVERYHARELADHAQRIGKAVRDMTTVIVAERAALDRAGRQAEPLVVLVGEEHAHVPAKIFVIGLLNELLQRGECVAFSTEKPHNTLRRVFYEVAKGIWTPDVAAMDADGVLSLKAKHGWEHHGCADQSYTALSAYLLQQQIVTCFTDAAIDRTSNMLKHDDLSTGLSMQTCLQRRQGGINALKPEGVQVRNHHMVEKMLAHAQATEARILIDQGGAAHVAGYQKLDLYGMHSKAALLKTKGLSSLAIFLEGWQFTSADVPSGHGLSGTALYWLNDMPPVMAKYDPRDADARAMEVEYFNAIVQRMGLAKAQLNDARAFEEQCRQDVRQAFGAVPAPAVA